MSTFYDSSLCDDAAHPHVIAARKAGRAWANQAWDALESSNQAWQSGQTWYATAVDARPLVEFDPTSEVEDQHEREHELAEICNDAAAEEWAALAVDFS